MHASKTIHRLAVPAVGLLLLSACADGSESTDSVQLEAAGEGSGDADVEDGEDDGADQADGAEVVDMTEAIAGTWPVGDAGTVTFSLDGGGLVLDDVAATDGWSSDVDEQSADEIEVDFRQGEVEWEIEIELEDGGATLEIEIEQDIRNAETGSYEIGDAGTFSFDVQDGALVLTDLNIADGWTQSELDEEADEIEFELVNGPRRFDVEVELDDGVIEIEIDFDIVGPVN